MLFQNTLCNSSSFIIGVTCYVSVRCIGVTCYVIVRCIGATCYVSVLCIGATCYGSVRFIGATCDVSIRCITGLAYCEEIFPWDRPILRKNLCAFFKENSLIIQERVVMCEKP